MKTIEDILAFALEVLKDGISEFAVEDFPNKPAEYQLTHVNGALLLRYDNSEFDSLQERIKMTQERLVTLDIAVIGRRLKGKKGIYAMLDKVRKLLTGKRFEQGVFFPVWEGFVNEENGRWEYAIRFGVWQLHHKT